MFQQTPTVLIVDSLSLLLQLQRLRREEDKKVGLRHTFKSCVYTGYYKLVDLLSVLQTQRLRKEGHCSTRFETPIAAFTHK